MDEHYGLAVHGGAGAKPGRDYALAEQHLAELLAKGQAELAQGVPALDVVERAVCAMEASGYYVAGKGSGTNAAGYVELDASIMDGANRRAGGVAAVRDVVHPVSAARRVMQDTPHVLLTGVGATHFARDAGLAFVENPSEYYRPAIGVTHEEQQKPERGHGTVGAVARDQAGRLAAATSTGGVFGKLEGRVGDTPLIGAGTWADEHVAVSCTGKGESFILAGGARDVSARLQYQGLNLQQAAEALIAEVGRLGGDGGLITVSNSGEVAMVFNSGGMKRGAVSSTEPLRVATFASFDGPKPRE